MNLTVDNMIWLSCTELMLIWNSDVDCARIYVRLILLIVYLSESFFWFIWGSTCFAYAKIVLNQRFSTFFWPMDLLFKKISDGPLYYADTSWTTSRNCIAHRWVNVLSKIYETLCGSLGSRWESLSWINAGFKSQLLRIIQRNI